MKELKTFLVENIIEESRPDFERGSWRGEDAWIVYGLGEEEFYILVGDGYTERDCQKVYKMFERGKDDLGKYDDDVLFVTAEEWEEQNY